MYSKQELENIIKLKLKLNNYESCNYILTQEIKQIFINKVKQYNNYYEYTDIYNLCNKVEKYLNTKENVLFRKYICLINEENNQLYELDCLVEIYNKLVKEVYNE